MTNNFIKRIDCYFENPGPENTTHTIKAIVERLREANIKTIIIASDSDKKTVKVCEMVKDLNARVIAIS
ncbi:MAG: hypothetical protein DRO15_07030 [Thermoprotei archaeon]|nr:MAG: hypothetical protein DRO15_07030 [Thermoprotei archaeon]